MQKRTYVLKYREVQLATQFSDGMNVNKIGIRKFENTSLAKCLAMLAEKLP